ncbi:hypothetical protein, partial [Amorphus orientalis]|uniref:hypothetical protein n=1 Tax=Amorphus orientalis TaxID=649198 RepID=UPI0027D77B85
GGVSGGGSLKPSQLFPGSPAKTHIQLILNKLLSQFVQFGFPASRLASWYQPWYQHRHRVHGTVKQTFA